MPGKVGARADGNRSIGLPPRFPGPLYCGQIRSEKPLQHRIPKQPKFNPSVAAKKVSTTRRLTSGRSAAPDKERSEEADVDWSDLLGLTFMELCCDEAIKRLGK